MSTVAEKTEVKYRVDGSKNHGSFPTTRMRRLRHNTKVRDMVRETQLSINDLMLPLFIRHGKDIKNPVSSMPGHHQLSVDRLKEEIKEVVELGIPSVLLFGIPEHKDGTGTDSYCEHGIIQEAIQEIKSIAPDLLVTTDVCFCEFTDHGHCGVVNHKTGKADVDNDATLELLAKQAVAQAQAGADMVAPSGNIDGMVAAIRQALDVHGFEHIPLMSYAVKYASGMYGPFREAAEGAPKFGNRATYQMDPANAREALREVALDISEGADIVMVKPALPYLDVIRKVKDTHPEVPMAAYCVSGEYAMLKAAFEKGWLDEERVTLEILTSIKRAGADIIMNYFCKDVARWLG